MPVYVPRPQRQRTEAFVAVQPQMVVVAVSI